MRLIELCFIYLRLTVTSAAAVDTNIFIILSIKVVTAILKPEHALTHKLVWLYAVAYIPGIFRFSLPMLIISICSNPIQENRTPNSEHAPFVQLLFLAAFRPFVSWLVSMHALLLVSCEFVYLVSCSAARIYATRDLNRLMLLWMVSTVVCNRVKIKKSSCDLPFASTYH